MKKEKKNTSCVSISFHFICILYRNEYTDSTKEIRATKFIQKLIGRNSLLELSFESLHMDDSMWKRKLVCFDFFFPLHFEMWRDKSIWIISQIESAVQSFRGFSNGAKGLAFTLAASRICLFLLCNNSALVYAPFLHSSISLHGLSLRCTHTYS